MVTQTPPPVFLLPLTWESEPLPPFGKGGCSPSAKPVPSTLLLQVKNHGSPHSLTLSLPPSRPPSLSAHPTPHHQLPLDSWLFSYFYPFNTTIMRFFTLSLAVVASTVLLARFSEAVAACDPATCVHPTCVCPSFKPPKGMNPPDVPQFFTLTFDDAVQAPTVPVAHALMAPHVNPNGCPIKATWFAQTIYSDYSLIQQWYAAGNEVADHTMNHIGTPPAGKQNMAKKNCQCLCPA